MNRAKFAIVLNQLIEKKGFNKKQLAQHSGISRATLYNVLQGNVGEARLSTLIKLASALDAHPLELLTPYFADSYSQRKLSCATKKIDTGFVTDTTYPDNSPVYPGASFIKTWSVINSGKNAWKNLYLACQDIVEESFEKGNYLVPEFNQIVIPYTEPGQRIYLSVLFTAPIRPCRVISHWKTVDAEGNLVFPEKQPLSCLIKVISI
jgi:DNA-binding Xre family transcriptional regulator